MKKAFKGLFSIQTFRNNYLAVTVLAVLLFTQFSVKSQTFTPIHNAQAIDWIAAVKYLGVPYGPTPALNATRTVPGAIFFNTTDSSFYVWTGTQWLKNTGGGTIINPAPGVDSIVPTSTGWCWWASGVPNCLTYIKDTVVFYAQDFTVVPKEVSGSRYDTIKIKRLANGAFFDSSHISGDGTKYIYYNTGDSVGEVPINSSVNLANTNLFQTGGNRTYDANFLNLHFKNLSNLTFQSAAGSIDFNNANIIFSHSVGLELLAPNIKMPVSINNAFDRVIVSDASGNLRYRDVGTITGGGAAVWGSITGTLSAQTDLQAALNLKASQSALIDSAAAIRADFPAAGTTTGLYEEVIATAGQTTVPFTTVPAATAKFAIVLNGGIVPKSYYSTSGNNIIFSSGLNLNDSVIIQGVQ